MPSQQLRQAEALTSTVPDPLSRRGMSCSRVELCSFGQGEAHGRLGMLI